MSINQNVLVNKTAFPPPLLKVQGDETWWHNTFNEWARGRSALGAEDLIYNQIHVLQLLL